MDKNMLPLWGKSDNYYIRLLQGKCRGRRWNVWDYFRTYMQMLGQIGRNLFYYEGYGNEDLFREMEKRLYYFGCCGIVKHSGELIAVKANGNTPGIYDKPERFTFVFGGGVQDHFETPNEREIGKAGVYGYNTFEGFPTVSAVEHYALMLAHTDASITMELVNGRMVDVMKVSNNRSAEAASAYSKKLYDGDYSFLEDKTEELEIDRANSSRGSRLRELLDTKERILKDVYAMFGINRVSEKRERLISAEADGSGAMLLLNLKDMLEMRKKFVTDINNTFGMDIKVRCHIDIDNDGRLEHEAEADDTAPTNDQPEAAAPAEDREGREAENE